MDYWDNALDANSVFYVLLRTTITNQLYEIVTFNQFFFKRLFGRTKKYLSCYKPLNTGWKLCWQKATNFWFELGKWTHFIFFFFYLFNSLFTVDFSIAITTNLHRLTKNFIIKKKFKSILKVATRGAFRIQSKPEMEILSKTVNRYKRWTIFSKSPTSDA